jgi:hypothetical protein
MIHLLADDTPQSVLGSLVEPAVIYDATGTRVIGQFVPADPERGKRLYEEFAARLDPAELACRSASGARGRTLEEIKTSRHAGRDAGHGAAPADAPLPSGGDGCATP